MLRLGLLVIVAVSLAEPVAGQALVEMRNGMPDAKFVPEYSRTQRAKALQDAMGLSSLPMLGAPVSLTPDAPYATDGSHLSFWKPSFVIGTANGGEAGFNYWGKYQDGHMNVGLAPHAASTIVLDCRMFSAGGITYKIYTGAGGVPGAHGEGPLRNGHFLLLIPGVATDEPISVELWPATPIQTVGVFGCDISRTGKGHP